MSGFPLAEDVGYVFFELKSDTGWVWFSQSISLNVQEVNDAPIIKNSPPNSVAEDSGFAHQFEFSDEEDGSENLLFEITDAPEWMSVSASGLITGTPTTMTLVIMWYCTGHRQCW